MATKQITVDDITGQEIAGTPIKGTITITLTGENLPELDGFKIEKGTGTGNAEFDLSFQSAEILGYVLSGDIASLFTAIKPLIKESRTPENNESDTIRTWLISHGYAVNARGRIPAEFIAVYRKATEVTSNSGGRA